MSQAMVGDNAFLDRKKAEEEEEMLEKLRIEDLRIADAAEAEM